MIAVRLYQQVQSLLPERRGSWAWWTAATIAAVPRSGDHVVIGSSEKKLIITVHEVFYHLKKHQHWGGISIALVPVSVSSSFHAEELDRDFREAGWILRPGFWDEYA